MKVHRRLVLAAGVAACVGITAAVTASLGGAAATDAIANGSSGLTKIVYTGGTVPGTNYSVIGRLTLPVGSFAVVAKTNLISSGPTTGVECYLLVPNNGNTGVAVAGIGNASEEDRLRELSFTTVTNAPNGGNADLRCRLTSPAADRTVKAFGTEITAWGVTGAKQTSNAPPPEGG